MMAATRSTSASVLAVRNEATETSADLVTLYCLNCLGRTSEDASSGNALTYCAACRRSLAPYQVGRRWTLRLLICESASTTQVTVVGDGVDWLFGMSAAEFSAHIQSMSETRRGLWKLAVEALQSLLVGRTFVFAFPADKPYAKAMHPLLPCAFSTVADMLNERSSPPPHTKGDALDDDHMLQLTCMEDATPQVACTEYYEADLDDDWSAGEELDDMLFSCQATQQMPAEEDEEESTRACVAAEEVEHQGVYADELYIDPAMLEGMEADFVPPKPSTPVVREGGTTSSSGILPAPSGREEDCVVSKPARASVPAQPPQRHRSKAGRLLFMAHRSRPPVATAPLAALPLF